MRFKNSKERNPKIKKVIKPKTIIYYKPEDFNKLIEDINLINQINKHKLFFKEINNSGLLNQFSDKYIQYIDFAFLL